MAERARAFRDNVAGPFFVDESCIDCGTCYTWAPEVFAEALDHSHVARQPQDDAQRLRAQMALVACPTASIGSDDSRDARAASEAFPVPIGDGVAFCGYTSEKSYGAWSYFVQRSGGNLLVDSPRAAAPLLRRLEQQGGVSLMVLSHRDDVADHALFQRRFGCERVMHRDDGVPGLERYLDGDEPMALAPDLLAIPVPGHTRGSICLLYRNSVLFTGDHLWWSPARAGLSASRAVNWYSWERQLQSLEKLLDFEFQVVLPGHGRAHRADSPAAMRRELEQALVRLRAA